MRNDELIAFLKEEIERCEERIRFYKELLMRLQPNGWKVGEKIEEVREKRKKYGMIYMGEDYVRAVPNFPMPRVAEIENYIKNMVNEIREMQARIGGDGPLAKYEIEGDPIVQEIKISNLFTAVEKVRAKAFLKTALMSGYEIYEAQQKKNK